MKSLLETKSCSIKFVLAINDTRNVMSGNWKLPIIGTLLFGKRLIGNRAQHPIKNSPYAVKGAAAEWYYKADSHGRALQQKSNNYKAVAFLM